MPNGHALFARRMNEHDTLSKHASPVGMPESAIGLIDLLILLARNKRLVIGLPVLAAVLAAAVSLMVPDVYRASAKLLPPQPVQSGATAMLAQLSGVAGAVTGGALKNPNDLYVGMLRSRTVADRLIAQYSLKKLYGTGSQDEARRQLAQNTTVSTGKDNLIQIDVEDVDRALAAKLANGYVAELIKLTKTLALTEAAQRRLFFEQQMGATNDKLAKAELTLKRALDTKGVINVEGESRARMETVALLRARLAAKEIEISSMQAFVTANNQDYQRAVQERNSVRQELSRFENGRPGDVIPRSESGLENIKVLREVKYHQMLYELLAKQYEMARLDEAQNSGVVQVLDEAVEPERKFKPKRLLIVIAAGLFGFLVGLGIALVSELRTRSLQNPARAAKWLELRRLMSKAR